MMYLFALVLALSAFEIWGMARRKQKKEIYIFLVIALLSLGIGIFYVSNPYRESLAQKILKLYNQQF